MVTGDKAIVENPVVAAAFPDQHPPFEPQAALIESQRCLFCFDAPCTNACPTHIDVPRFIKKISTGNLRGSALAILDANILGASCSRVCPVDVLCEGACVMQRHGKEPIEIGRLQRHAMDYFYRTGASLRRKETAERSEKVACIGAGPASLACAAELRLRGFRVAVFDARPLPGGLNTYGVAEYKLRAVDSLREIELIRSLGAEFRFGTAIDTPSAFERLEKEFDAIFLGIGLGPMHKLGIPGEDLPGVVNALQFIEEYKTGGRTSAGRRTVVVGAGNTAIDAARAAKRLGAEEVRIVYRRDAPQMPAFSFEFEHAREEGVIFQWRSRPVAIRANSAGTAIASVECATVEVPVGGTTKPTPSPHFEIACDMVIPAIGQSPLLEFLEKLRGITLDRGRVRVDRATGRTSSPRYFAGGDCVNGGREVVDAVADGKRAGEAIAEMLEVTHA